MPSSGSEGLEEAETVGTQTDDADLKIRANDVESACVVSVIGLDAISTNKLRGELKAKNVRLQVVQNNLARRALAQSTLAPLGAVLEGPCALVTGGGSMIDVAKLLVGL